MLFCLFYLLVATCSAQTAKEAVAQMGKGINFGNSWDGNSNGVTSIDRMRVIIDKSWQKGFKHCRFTVTWTMGSNPQPSGSAGGNLSNLKQSVQYALSKGFFVILNWHWNHPNSGNYAGAFVDGWKAIAGNPNYFSRSSFPSRRLMFEVLNEPNYNSVGGGETLTRDVNWAGYNAIRSVDSTRIVFVMPDNQGNWWNLNSVYPSNNLGRLPGGGRDAYLAVNVHSYDPWDFAGNGAQAAYPGCGYYQNMANSLASWSAATGVAVIMSEFGLQKQARDSWNDKCYISLMSNLLRGKGIAPTIWNDYGGFGIINSYGDFTNSNGAKSLAGCDYNCGCC